MTVYSWIYIGTQGILQGTYETLPRPAQRHLRVARLRFLLTGGLAEWRRPAPAATMNGLPRFVEVTARIRRRIETRYCDRGPAA